MLLSIHQEQKQSATGAPKEPLSKTQHHNKDWWLNHYQNWQKSDLSKATYCRQESINEKNFYNWAKKFRDEANEPKTTLTPFIPVKLDTNQSPPIIELTLADVCLKITGTPTDKELTTYIRSIRQSL